MFTVHSALWAVSAISLSLFPRALAEVTTFPYPVPLPTGGPYIGWQAYDPTQLQDPPLPAQQPPLDFQVTLDTGGQPAASIPLQGSLMGVSIEMSLSEAIIGPNATWLRPQFLNLMSLLADRGGPPVLRLGGNTQEKAELVDSLPNNASLSKFAIGPTGFTNTPTLRYTLDIIRAVRAASDLLGVKWFLGVPLNQTNPPRLQIMEQAEELMGEFLWGWQLGNEPDLYANHNYRPQTYSIQNYIDEFQVMLDAIDRNPIVKVKNNIGGPGVCCLWHLQDVLTQYNYLQRFRNHLSSMIIEHYPLDNCVRGQHDPQQTLNEFMMHSSPQKFGSDYKDEVQLALQAGLPVILLETNTASCNGFLGLSDAMAAALWIADLGLQLGATGFSHIMVHLGGQAAYYNPFVSPPHNATTPFMWTVGPPFYGMLAVAEAIGKSGAARVADLNMNGGNTYTPGYVVYENNQPVRLVMINYMSDPSGAHDYVARVQWPAAEIHARYLLAPQVTSKIPNITWAGQNFGSYFESDGLPRGEHVTQSIPCTGGSCAVKVPAPGLAVIFLTENAMFQPNPELKTFVTEHTTRMHNTAAVPLDSIKFSNGMSAKERIAMGKKSTSAQVPSGATSLRVSVWTVLAACAAMFGRI